MQIDCAGSSVHYSTEQLKRTFKESRPRPSQLEAEMTALLALLHRENSVVDHEPRWTGTNNGYDALLFVSTNANPDNPVSPVCNRDLSRIALRGPMSKVSFFK